MNAAVALHRPGPETWQALARAAVYVPLPAVGSLRLTGDDRLSFLQGQAANDVMGVPVGGSVRSAFLDVRGQAVAEARVQRRSSDLHLAVEDDAAEALAERLRRHVIFDAVEVRSQMNELMTVALCGAGAEAVARSAGIPFPDVGHAASFPLADASALAVRNERSGSDGIDVHLLARHEPELRARLTEAGAVAPADALAAFEAGRVMAGRPRAGADGGAATLPQELALWEAFSTRKGCYLGQEIMARIEARAALRRGLARLQFASAPDDRSVRDGHDREAGRLGTVALLPDGTVVALAVLRFAAEAPLQAGGAAVTAWDWVDPRSAPPQAAGAC